MANQEAAAVWVSVDELVPWEKNPRMITGADVKEVAGSIERFGFGAPIIARLENKELIAGHVRLQAAKKLGLKQVPVRFLDLPEGEAHALALADNELGAEWSDDLDSVLKELGGEVDVSGLGWSDDALKEMFDGLDGGGGDGGGNGDSPSYTTKVKAPVYEPKGDKPPIEELVKPGLATKLLEEIEAADMPAELRQFLKLAAYRHHVFDYGQIAEFYCHASAEVQGLMENSALVIIDFDKAIEQGFVQMSKALSEAYKDDREARDAE